MSITINLRDKKLKENLQALQELRENGFSDNEIQILYNKQVEIDKERERENAALVTLERAKKILDPETSSEADIEAEYYGGFRAKEYWKQEVDEACKIAVDAIKRQIPKKATEETINRGIDITGEYDIDFNLCCPVCGAVVGTFESGENEYFTKYCGNCGQALDWSEN